MDLQNINYGFIGLGLMGGSMAKAIRENILNQSIAKGKIFACDINRVSLEQAASSLIIDRGYELSGVDAMLKQCDLVIICLYPHKTLEFLKEHKNSFKSGSIVTDISGVKSFIMENMQDFTRDDVDYIPGHPMAGSEKEGYVHATGSIFNNRNYILMPLQQTKSDNYRLLKNLITAIGFSRIIETDYKVHDHKIAFTSQLCHVIASALVASAEDEQITAFGGGSFEDLTRIAMINAPLWTELFLSNKKELIEHIEAFEKSLDDIKKHIQNDDSEQLVSCLNDVRTKRMAMSRIDTRA